MIAARALTGALALCIGFVVGAQAQGSYQTRRQDGDRAGVVAVSPAQAEAPATKEEIAAAFIGKTAKLDWGGEAIYGKDYSFQYSDKNGPRHGRYNIADGEICVAFSTGQNACNKILKSGSSFILFSSGGMRSEVAFK